MDCRKARFCLVASFDGPLDPETKRELGYHLKDCRACRHESFYYRELFSAERQLDLLQPSSDFNERLVARIRLREAQAAWPNRTSRPAGSRRLSLFLAPGLFTAAAALAFVIFVQPMQSHREAQSPEIESNLPVSLANANPAATPPDHPSGPTPRYAPSAASALQIRRPEEMFRVRYPMPSDVPDQDAFVRLVRETLGSDYARMLPDSRPQERTNYLLPVVQHGNSPERIY